MSIESNILREIDFTAVINVFVVAKSRKLLVFDLRLYDYCLCWYVMTLFPK